MSRDQWSTTYMLALFALGAGCGVVPVAAQELGHISGRVREGGGAAIVGAQVSLDGGLRGVLTDDFGTFTFRNVSAGRHRVSVIRIGYTTYDAEVTVGPGSTVALDIGLQASAVPLAGVTVIGSREEIEETRRLMRNIPGAVALLEPARIRQSRQATFGDVLRLTPGVFVQPRFGAADEAQFSIRGSGLRNNFHLRGVNILMNGMPYRLADGFTDFETLELLNMESIEVYKGANALRYGGSTLGGAVNFNSKTGYTASPIELFAQAGSYGFTKAQIASGDVLGDFNYYASYARTDVKGFREYSGQQRDRVNVHAGYSISDAVNVRAFYWFANVFEDLPGALTSAQVAADGRAAHPNNLANQYGRDYKLHHVGGQLRAEVAEGARIDIAPYFQYRDIVHPIFRVLDQVSKDVGAEARYQERRDLLGHRNSFTLGVQWAWGVNDNKQYQNLGGTSGALAKDQDDFAGTLAVYAEEVLDVTDRFKAVVGARWARDVRRLEDFFPSDGDQTDERHYEAFQPKFGVLYEVPSVAGQLFANASRMYEPPLLLEINSLTLPGFVDLSAQRAWQFEVGSRGRSGGFQWDLALYDLEIDDEIININVQPFPGAPFTVPTYRNASATRHYGLEAALAYELPGSVFLSLGVQDRIGARLAYTWGRFEYVTDTNYAGNRLPGVPEHYVQAELEYSHPSGLALRPTFEWAPGTYFVDSANTVENDGWFVLGARLDWALPRFNGSFFLEARNLTNEQYSPAVAVDDAAGRFFYPADGRSFYTGFRWQPVR